MAAQRVIRAHGVVPDLYDALRAMQPVMRSHSSDKSARVAIDRALFFETHLSIDLAACAAGIIKRDLRAMSSGTRGRWQSLLLLGMSTKTGAPRPAWTRRVGAFIDRIGAERVASQNDSWLRELSERAAFSVTPAGADAARTLAWLATQVGANDAEPYLLALARYPWRRGSGWGPRHDRWVGGLAYALGESRAPRHSALLIELETEFRHTTARHAIGDAIEKVASLVAVVSRSAGIRLDEWTRAVAADSRLLGPTTERVNAFTGETRTYPSGRTSSVGIRELGVTLGAIVPAATLENDGTFHAFATEETAHRVRPIVAELARRLAATVE